MKKQAQRVSSFVLVLMIVFSCFGVALTADAASNESPNYYSPVTSYSDLSNRLNTLISKYNGTYWTTTGSASDSSGSTSKYYYGIQCKGFASYIFNDLFCQGYIGAYDTNKYYIPNVNGAYLIDKSWNFSSTDTGTVKNILIRANIGDFVQVRRRGKTYGHSMIIAGVDDGGITIFDCNSDGKCGVKHYYQTWATFASKNIGMSLYRANNYPIDEPDNKPHVVSVQVDEGTNYTPTSFWWSNSDNADHYDLKLWQGTYWNGDPYKCVWNVKTTSCSVNLPAGYYEGYVDSVNSYGVTMSNIIKFTIKEGEKVDKGDDFYATILRNDGWRAIADIDGNVCLNDEKNNVWHFRKLSDGGYTIQNAFTQKYLDVYYYKDEDGTNVQTWEYNGTSAQIWYIYGRWSGEYYLKPQCTTNKVLDIQRDTSNALIWSLDYNDNQKFAIYPLNTPEATNVDVSVGNKYKPTRIWWNQTNDTNNYTLRIYKDKIWEGKEIGSVWNTTNTMCSVNLPAGYYEAYVDSNNDYSYTMSNNIIKFTVTEGTPETIDTNFYAYIINTNTEAYLINDKNGNACFNKPANVDNLQKIWYFTRNDNDSFTITSVLDNNVLDVYDNQDENGANVQLWVSKNGANQQWYIQGESPYYQIKPAFTDRALDLNGGKYYDNVNAQIWEKNETDAQKYKIVVVEKPVVSYNMNGGSGTIKAQTKEFGKDLTLSLTKPTRTGYAFLGWNTDKNATTAQYQPGGKYTANTSATLYAIWKEYEYELSGWTWNGTSSATANFNCKDDSSQNKTVNATITSKTTNATCETAGKTVYTATATFNGKTYIDTKEVPISAKGHNYKLTSWSWNGYSSATATFTCENDSKHTQTVNATITNKTTAATCEKAGKTVYTATATFNGKTYTDTKEAPISAKGHSYKLTDWNWNGYDSATATFTCENDSKHTQTVNATITSKTTNATCETAGTTVYTATATFEGKNYTDTKEATIPAKGHKYVLTSWNWNGENASAIFTCENNKTHTTTVTANVTSKTEGDTVIRTAAVVLDGQPYTDTKTEIITPAQADSDSDTDNKTSDTNTEQLTDSENASDTEISTDTQIDSDNTVDTESNTETHSNIVIESDSDKNSDTETSTDTSTDDVSTDSEPPVSDDSDTENTDVSTDIKPTDSTDTETETDTSSESDTVSDTDTSTDTNSDTNINSDVDTSDSDSDTPNDSETDTASEVDTSSDINSDTDTNSDIDTSSDNGSDTESKTDTDIQSDSDTDTSKEVDTETDSDNKLDDQTDTYKHSDTDEQTVTDTPDIPDDKAKGTYGDLDGDGDITANDALMILRASVGMETLTPEQIALADVDGDGDITANDALAVLRYSVGMGDGGNVGKPIT